MADYGISDEFIKTTREKVTEGSSALFLMTSDAVLDKVTAELKGYEFELIASNLTKEQEDQINVAFAEEQAELLGKGLVQQGQPPRTHLSTNVETSPADLII